MKILHVTGEAVPLVKTGGLGDAVYSLAKAEASLGHQVAIAIPYYSKVSNPSYNSILNEKYKTNIHILDKNIEVTIYSLLIDSVTYYLVSASPYFDRDKLYGYDDDGERFALFNLAVIRFLKEIDHIDVAHFHDWHGGFGPVLIKNYRETDPYYNNIKTIMTIHNPAYQGLCARSAIRELFSLDENKYNDGSLDFKWGISFLKAGLVYADEITTVSKNHACELIDGYNSYDLEGVLKLRQSHFVGIVNGIDNSIYSPTDDCYLKHHYSDLQGKKECKKDLQKHFKLEVNDDNICLSFIARLTWQKGVQLFILAIPKLIADNPNLQIYILGVGDKAYEESLTSLARKYPKNIALVLAYDENIAHLIYAGSDYTLMSSLYEPCGSNQLIAYRYLTIPIVRATGGLVDTVLPYNEFDFSGTGFSFKEFDSSTLTFITNYAFSFFHTPHQQKIIENIQKLDFSWIESAKEYLKLYE